MTLCGQRPHIFVCGWLLCALTEPTAEIKKLTYLTLISIKTHIKKCLTYFLRVGGWGAWAAAWTLGPCGGRKAPCWPWREWRWKGPTPNTKTRTKERYQPQTPKLRRKNEGGPNHLHPHHGQHLGVCTQDKAPGSTPRPTAAEGTTLKGGLDQRATRPNHLD